MGRYDRVEVTTIAVPDGAGGLREVRYLHRRELPDPRDVRPLAVHRVVAGDRLDLISHRYFSDPLAAWVIADANFVLDPDELTAVEAEGDLLIVPMPGVPR